MLFGRGSGIYGTLVRWGNEAVVKRVSLRGGHRRTSWKDKGCCGGRKDGSRYGEGTDCVISSARVVCTTTLEECVQ